MYVVMHTNLQQQKGVISHSCSLQPSPGDIARSPVQVKVPLTHSNHFSPVDRYFGVLYCPM